MVLHPRYKRYFRQAFYFGLIWLIFGLVYSLLEYGILGRATLYPSTGNRYHFPSALLYTATGSFLMGMLQGWIEVVWLRKRFAKSPLWTKILCKGSFYLILLIVFLASLTVATNMKHFNTGPFHPEVLNSLLVFMKKFAFWSVTIYAAMILGIALLFSEISDYLGVGVLRNFFIGTYHRPKGEKRIFMFLDMKSSTTIAEHIGHEKYFKLLKACYADMTDPVLETSGEIYQYVGDEIVVSWPINVGIYQNNCIRCFSKIEDVFRKNKDFYLAQFNVFPEFKAGFHLGAVTTGEIGIIKKDIIHTGDVLNTTARIQAQCNAYNAKALISGDLLEELQKKDPIEFERIGKLTLRGKKTPVQLYRVQF
ncbi:MAG TPA: adenylate/guanylate cyclase domain-containing protein [Eudoraea sp.]|nr:adenylate/guanylate cyclase domain-containing protein [Eudoraea sp.]